MRKTVSVLCAVFAFAVSALANVEILYFHGRQRCPTCLEIESQAKTLVESDFAKELAEKKLVFRTIDISLPENREIVDKFRVSWSSLFIANADKTENLTRLAFANARRNPDMFKVILKEKIAAFLKE